MKTEQKVRDEFKGALTEIGAGMVIFAKDDASQAYNNACDRAMRIVKMYINGDGLFQITVPAPPEAVHESK